MPATGAGDGFPWGERVLSRGADETRAFAARLLDAAGGKAVIALHGELGSGKTCFVQGLAAALGVRARVTSPTFTLVNEYRGGRRPLFHMDLYRLRGPADVLPIGLDECLEGGGVTAIEWADRAGDLLPPETIDVYLYPGQGADERWLLARRATEGERSAVFRAAARS